MEKIYAYTYFKFDKYGDEEQHYGFLSASDAEEAHGIAIDLLNGVDSFVCAHCGKSSPIGLDVYAEHSGEFWNIFVGPEEFWAENLLEWAEEEPEMAVRLWKMAANSGYFHLLELDQLRALVEQQEIKESMAEPQATTETAKPKSKSL